MRLLDRFKGPVTTNMTFLQRLRMAQAVREQSPGFSHCLRCQMPWNVVDGHTLMVTESTGMFPLCEQCWDELGTSEARLPFLEQHVIEAQYRHPEEESYEAEMQQVRWALGL
jgi:hypothetical protein